MSGTIPTLTKVSPTDRTTRLLTPLEVADFLQVAPRTVNRYAADGRLRRIKVGARLTRYRFSDVLALIDADTETPER